MSNGRTWTDEQFIEAVKRSVSLSEIGRKLGMKNFGANGHTYKKYIKLLNLDTSHFLSRKELLNKARQKNTSISDEELFQVNQIDRGSIKKRIIKNNLLPYACNECGISSWKNKPLSLHLDHINGVNNDNRLSNMQFLCPNCHAQTDSYCGKNKRNVEKKDKVCLDCKCKIHEQSTRCRKCSSLEYRGKATKIDWPSTEALIARVKESSYVQVGKTLGVSDNAVKKRIRNYP